MPTLKRPVFTHFFAFFYATAGLTFGLGVGAFTTFFRHYIKNVGNFSDDEQNSIRSNLGFFFTLGALICCTIGGFLIQLMGRYYSIVVVLVVEIAAIASMAIPNLRLMFFLRLIIGYCACFWTLSVPGLMFEVFPPSIAGIYSGLFGAVLTAGIGIGFAFAEDWAGKYWRVVLCWPAVWETIRLGLMLTVFRIQSPIELADREKPKEFIVEQYKKLYNDDDAGKMAEDLIRNARSGNKSDISWKDLFSSKFSIQIFLAILLNMLNQLTGINIFAFYCSDIFESFGFNSTLAAKLSIGFTFFGVISSVIVSFIAAKVSIRSIIIWGLFLQALGYFLFIVAKTFSLTALVPAIIGPYVYSFGYSQSLGGLMYGYCSLIVPAKIMPYCVFFQWLLCSILVKFIPDIQRKLGYLKMCFTFQVFTFVGTILFVGYSVDLQGVLREDIVSKFANKKFFY